jgi:hypothetical protein
MGGILNLQRVAEEVLQEKSFYDIFVMTPNYFDEHAWQSTHLPQT